MKTSKCIILSILLVCTFSLFGQNGRNRMSEGLNYSVVKLKHDTTVTQGPAGIEVRIAKSQFDSPTLVTMTLKNQQDSLVLEKVAELDLISGARADSLKVFSVDRNNFIFTIRNIPPKKYKILFQVIQDNGEAFYVRSEENWWENKKGGGKP